MTVAEYENPNDWAVMNWRKVQILQLIADGKRYKEIAEITGTSHSTVKNTIHKCTKQFEAHTVPQMIAIAIRQGIIK